MDCVTINYHDAADIYRLPMYINVYTVKVICYRLDSLRVNCNCKRLTLTPRTDIHDARRALQMLVYRLMTDNYR